MRQHQVLADGLAELQLYLAAWQLTLAWIASWAALSAAWHVKDGGEPDAALAVSEIALDELGGSEF